MNMNDEFASTCRICKEPEKPVSNKENFVNPPVDMWFSAFMIHGDEMFCKDLELGGKIFLPSSTLDALTNSSIIDPTVFKLSNEEKNKITYCGIAEYNSDDGIALLPCNIMRNLLLNEGDLIKIECVSQLPVASYVSFEPTTSSFLQTTIPEAILKHGLRGYACLVSGDKISFRYNEDYHELHILETKPASTVSIIGCEFEIEFVPPLVTSQEQEALVNKNVVASVDTLPQPTGFAAFGGENAESSEIRKDSINGTFLCRVEPGVNQEFLSVYEKDYPLITVQFGYHLSRATLVLAEVDKDPLKPNLALLHSRFSCLNAAALLKNQISKDYYKPGHRNLVQYLDEELNKKVRDFDQAILKIDWEACPAIKKKYLMTCEVLKKYEKLLH